MIQIDGYASSDTGKEYRGQMLNVEEQPVININNAVTTEISLKARCYNSHIGSIGSYNGDSLAGPRL